MVLFYSRHAEWSLKSRINFFPCVRSSALTSAGLPGIYQKPFLGKYLYSGRNFLHLSIQAVPIHHYPLIQKGATAQNVMA